MDTETIGIDQLIHIHVPCMYIISCKPGASGIDQLIHIPVSFKCIPSFCEILKHKHYSNIVTLYLGISDLNRGFLLLISCYKRTPWV